jgi:glycosyltransferase involved in cell wall biosynthesis
MLILMDCRPLFAEGSGVERSRFILSAAAAISSRHGVQWLLLADRTYSHEQLLKWMGVTTLPAGFSVITRGTLPGSTGWRVWYDWVVPRLARKHRADAVLLTGGIAAVAGTIPQILWMPVNASNGGGYLPLYSRRLKESLSRASLVFCFSDADKDRLSGRSGGTAAVTEMAAAAAHGPDAGAAHEQAAGAAFEMSAGAATDKFIVLPPWPSQEAPPLSPDEREAIKQTYATGKEYFLADVSASSEEKITQLLKSFSLFKKRQLSNLQLILAGGGSLQETGLRQRLGTYKYREDVSWAQQGEAEDRLAAAAYAFLFPYPAKTLGVPVLNAWRSEVPVIIGKDPGLQEWAGDAVLVAEMEEPASLATHMMTIYKDERLRRELIEKGGARVAEYQPQRSLDTIWTALSRVIRQPAAGSM